MTAQALATDRRIIERYTDQPSVLPAELRREIESRLGGGSIQLYALADLDESLQLAETWLAVGESQVGVCKCDGRTTVVRTFARAAVQVVRLEPGLSCNTFLILGEPGEPALARLRFTHRQRRAMENVLFLLEQALEGRGVDRVDPDEVYADSVAGPVREAQALVAGNDMSVLLRLLSYLRPYRGQVVFGFVSAVVLTVLALIPPYLTGVLIDQVILPVSDGVKTVDEVRRFAKLSVAAIALAYAFRQLAAWARLRWMSILGEHVARDLRTEL